MKKLLALLTLSLMLVSTFGMLPSLAKADTPTVAVTFSVNGLGWIVSGDALTVDTVPVHLTGAPLGSSTTFYWTVGSTHSFAWNSPVIDGLQSSEEYVFASSTGIWSGQSGTAVTVPDGGGAVTANYDTYYQVTFAAYPVGAGTTNPSLGIHWYKKDSTITISAQASSAYTFNDWGMSWFSPISLDNSHSSTTQAKIGGSDTITANFASVPNPVGISDLGIGTNSITYQYSTSSFVGKAKINSLSANTIPGFWGFLGDHSAGIQLNVNLVFISNGKQHVFWVQDVAIIDTSSSNKISFLDNIWDSSTGSITNPTSVTGNGQLEAYQGQNFYYDWSNGPGTNVNLQYPVTVTLSVSCAQNAAGNPTVNFAYEDGYGVVTYDTVTITTGNPVTAFSAFVVNGAQPKPVGGAFDAELILGGPGGGASTTIVQSDVELHLEYQNGNNYQTIKNAFNYGLDTAEGVTNAQCQILYSGDGELFAKVTAGTQSKSELYDSSMVGIIDVKTSLTSGTLYVTNSANSNAGTWQTAYVNREVTVTLAPGSYTLQLYFGGVLYYQVDCTVTAGQTVSVGPRTGGPDSFGYTYSDSNSLQGPSYNWIEISGTGTEILPDSDDQWVGNIGLGFFFNYYGTDYSTLAIGNNGLLFSGTGTSQYVNDPITQSPTIHGFIAPYWDDLVTWGSAGAVYYQTQGTAPNRQFVVEWYDNQHYYSSTSGITFEAIVYEGSNNILFQYKDVDFGTVSGSTSGDLPPYNNGGSATVGIEDPTGNIGLQYSFDEQVITPGLAILFKFPAFVGTNMHLSMNAPVSMDHGNTVTYTLYYNDFGDTAASNVVLQATLSSNIDFVSASDAGTYNSATRTVTWNIGTVPAFPSGRGSTTITATIPTSIPVGTVIQTTASISTSTLETRYDDNTASAQTTVTGSSLPPNVGVGPTLGNSGGVPSVYWGTPITFTYYDSSATAVDIRIHLTDGGPDITGSMTGGPPLWSFTVTFYPRHGQATVTYTVHGATTQSVSFNIYVDPAGYIYNVVTLQRVSGASVWLQRSDGQGGWENVPTGQTPPIMQPDTNPLITGADGQYQWDVLAGSYRVHVEAPGYYPADSIVVTVPPAVTDLHVGLTPLPPPADDIPPTTTLAIGNPGYCDPSGNVYVTSSTPFTLTAEDNVGGSGVATTGYRIHACDLTYDSGWTCCAPPTGFYLTGIVDGSYFIDYNSTDNSANTEALNTVTVILDNTPPTTSLTIDQPKYTDASNNVYVSSATPFTLIATDNLGGTGVALTSYRIYNNTYSEGWQAYSTAFYLTSLQDGTYFIDYNSTDAIGNVEPKNTATVILDNTPPTTNLSIGDPKYVSSRTYVTPDTPFTLIATDAGSGVKLTTYRINSTTYDSGWLTYTNPFNLSSLADGNYTIAFNSTDNVGNVETTHRMDVTRFSWNYVFKDSDGRGTILKICTAYKFFQFIAPDKDFGVRYASKMIQLCKQVTITCYEDSQMRLTATAVDDKTCVATVYDKQTGKTYWLIEHPPTYKLTICCKDSNGKAISGANVYLNGCCKGQTDSNGNLIITNVLAGRYTVTVKKCGYKDSSSTTTVTGDATLTITLTTQTYTLTVCCKDSKGKAISGVSVYVNSIYRGTTDLNGKLVITNITAGTYTVTVKKTGYKDTSVNVTVSSDKTVTITMK